MQFSSIPSGATTPGQSEPGSDGNEGVSVIPQSLAIKLFSVISREVLPLCRDAVGRFCCPC